ncbi:hypothetical protein F5Y05DRAFT_412879 [Hypoxylon sp. FL0543]|nr:hypothetical protein F5Y05DRAFT_412879 [Hypoxylon sp. FL0543]
MPEPITRLARVSQRMKDADQVPGFPGSMQATRENVTEPVQHVIIILPIAARTSAASSFSAENALNHPRKRRLRVA